MGNIKDVFEECAEMDKEKKMKRYRVICNEGTTFLSRTWKRGETEEEIYETFEEFYKTENMGFDEEIDDYRPMPRELDYIRDLWNVTIEEIENPNYSHELGDLSDWEYDDNSGSMVHLDHGWDYESFNSPKPLYYR